MRKMRQGEAINKLIFLFTFFKAMFSWLCYGHIYLTGLLYLIVYFYTLVAIYPNVPISPEQ